MHHLTHITIHNFRSCLLVDVPLAAFTPLVGYNNAGKSNILQAVRWLVTVRVLNHW
jgi:putative ATP-dependent endonuclease of OLD family